MSRDIADKSSITPFMKSVMKTLIDDEECVNKLLHLRLEIDTRIYHLNCQLDVEITQRQELQALIDFLGKK